MPRIKGYTLKEVTQKVGVVSATIIRWIETGKVRIRKKKGTQGHYVFTEADLQKLIEFKNRLHISEKTNRVQSGGINIKGNVSISGDVVGQDKIEMRLPGDSTTDAPPPPKKKKVK